MFRLGPRKLCKALLLCFKRWIKLQSAGADVTNLSTLAHDPLSGLSLDTGGDASVGDQEGYFDSHVQPVRLTDSNTSNITSAGTKTSIPSDALPRSELLPSPRSSPHPPSPPKPRFLLVEDNAINMRLLQAYIKKLGRPYDSVTDGRQALDAYENREGKYQCIFMDISMPVMDGFEATRHIRAFESEKQLSRCLILALTGLASKDAQEEAVAVGIDLFLSKPVKFKELNQVLESLSIT